MGRGTRWMAAMVCAVGIVAGGCSQGSMGGDKMMGDKPMEKKSDSMMEKK